MSFNIEDYRLTADKLEAIRKLKRGEPLPRLYLSDEEVAKANAIGFSRSRNARIKGVQDIAVVDDSLGIDGLGARTEFAASKLLGMPMDESRYSLREYNNRVFRKPDVGFVEVRGTDRANNCLIIQKREAESEQIFMLVVEYHNNPDGNLYTFPGWCRGKEVKPSYWDEGLYGRAAFYVPQYALHHMAELLGTPEAENA